MIRCTLSMMILSIASLVYGVQTAPPDISNLNSCIQEVREAAAHPPSMLTFDSYSQNYRQLIIDLQTAIPHLPYVYQQAAGVPLLQFLQNLGEWQFLEIFSGQATDSQVAVLQQMIPDAVLSVLSYKGKTQFGIEAFQEVVSDLYDAFLNDEARINKQTRRPIQPPRYGVLPPLVKFGNPDAGPYTWPGDATAQVLGMGCGVVSLPPAEIQGGLIAWPCLGHETGGHDITHAYPGMLDELAQKVRTALLQKFHSQVLADYWARCIDEAAADVFGYLHMGPSVGIGLIGYFRALGNGQLRAVGSMQDPHPIDLLRGYLAAEVVKRLHFQDASAWSQSIAEETSKDNAPLYLVDEQGRYYTFPVSFSLAIQSTGVVAETILKANLKSLQGHTLQELQDWTDQDEATVNRLVSVLKTHGNLPANLRGPGCFASYVVAAATVAALQQGADITTYFQEMQDFLVTMHRDNPIWSQTPTSDSIALLERAMQAKSRHAISETRPRAVIPALPTAEVFK